MTFRRTTMSRVRMLALLATAAAMLSACSPTPEPSPTPTAAFASEEEAFAAAEATYRAYNDAYNEVDFADSTTFGRLDAYTSGTYQTEEHEGLSQMHADRIARSGDAVIVWFRGLEFEDEVTISARVCKDLSSVEIRDADGHSLVAPDRADYSTVELTFRVQNAKVVLVESQAVTDKSCGRM